MTAATELRAEQDRGRKVAQNREKWAQGRTYISAAVILVLVPGAGSTGWW